MSQINAISRSATSMSMELIIAFTSDKTRGAYHLREEAVESCLRPQIAQSTRIEDDEYY